MAEVAEDVDGAGSTRGRVARAASVVFVAAAVAFAVAVLASQWSDVRASLELLSVGGVALAALVSVVSVLCSFQAWRVTLASLGTPVPMAPAARVFFVGQLGKYVPGSVWAIVGQMELGRAAGLRRERVATAGLLVLAISVTVALALGTLAVPALVEAGEAGYALLVLLVVPMAVVLHPRVLGPVLDRLFRVLRRPPLEHRPAGRAILAVAGLSVLSNGLLGLQAWILASDVGASGWRVLPLAVGGFSLAASAGLLAIPAPAGAGVREVVLVLALSPVLDVGGATLVALLSRALLTAVDLVTAAGASVGRARPHPADG